MTTKAAALRTPEEIESLKAQWFGDPMWDLEDTEGFEAHHDELLAYRQEKEAEWKSDHTAEVQAKADKLQCSFVLAHYILRLESQLEEMTERLDPLWQAHKWSNR